LKYYTKLLSKTYNLILLSALAKIKKENLIDS